MDSNRVGDIELNKTSTTAGEMVESENVVKSPKKSNRRPDIDIIRIGLTWGILMYHTVIIYAPYTSYYVKIIPEMPAQPWHLLALWFIVSMNAWNMPMFFFLSGISAFFGLKKRSENQFIQERLHRLFIPALFLALTASFPISTNILAKLSPNCQEYYDTGEVSKQDTEDAVAWDNCAMFYKFQKNTSYAEHLRSMFLPVGSPHQGWFLCYLLFYSCLLSHLLVAVHPNHQDDRILCMKRPLKKVTALLGLNFFCYPTTTHEEFIKGVKFWLGHPLKLFFVPSLWIGVVEVSLRWLFPDGNLWFFGFIFDICNDFKFIFIFVFGYGIMAADEHGMKEVIKKGRWYNLIIGIIINIIYSCNFFFTWMPWPFWFLRGFAEWLFIIGVYGVFREVFTVNYSWIPVLSELAMPFYLTHQQVLIPLVAATSWVPYLRSFPVVLILATLGSLIVSWLVTKSGPFRYFFGLPTKPDSLLPGKTMKGFLPLLILLILFITAAFVANFV